MGLQHLHDEPSETPSQIYAHDVGVDEVVVVVAVVAVVGGGGGDGSGRLRVVVAAALRGLPVRGLGDFQIDHWCCYCCCQFET